MRPVHLETPIRPSPTGRSPPAARAPLRLGGRPSAPSWHQRGRAGPASPRTTAAGESRRVGIPSTGSAAPQPRLPAISVRDCGAWRRALPDPWHPRAARSGASGTFRTVSPVDGAGEHGAQDRMPDVGPTRPALAVMVELARDVGPLDGIDGQVADGGQDRVIEVAGDHRPGGPAYTRASTAPCIPPRAGRASAWQPARPSPYVARVHACLNVSSTHLGRHSSTTGQTQMHSTLGQTLTSIPSPAPHRELG